MTNSSFTSTSDVSSTPTFSSIATFEAVERIGLPYAITKNGLYIVNLCSGHEFNLHDGTVVPACTTERVQATAMKTVEERIQDERGFMSIGLTMDLNKFMEEELERIYEITSGSVQHRIVVLVPKVVLDAMKVRKVWWDRLLRSPFRTIRSCGRETTGANGERNRPPSWADRFCH